MNKRERHAATLRRRRDYLTARVAVREGRGAERQDYDHAEIGALNYALAVMEDAERVGLPSLGELSIEERNRIRAALAGGEQAA